MSPPIELVVVADDITGSLDTGVQFTRLETGVVVTVWPSFPSGDIPGIVVVDTESRHLSSDEARHRVEDVVHSACERGARLLYKKVDSTLRGNVGAELEGMLAASGRERLAFAPAYPRMGRTTIEGCQLVNGTPIDRTSFAVDLLNPLWTSSIPEIIAAQSRVAVAVRRPSQQAAEVDARIVVLDARSDEELRAAARELLPQRDHWVFAGSAGFADALCREMFQAPGFAGVTAADGHAARSGAGTGRRKALVVVGSMSPASLAQVNYAIESGVPAFPAPDLDSELPEDRAHRGRGDLLRSTGRAFALGDVIILRTTAAPRTGADNGDGLYRAMRFAERFGRLAREIAVQERPDAVVIFGGDTFIAMMRAFAIDALAPVEEILPGVPASLTVTSGAEWRPRMFVSKAGGFGPPDVLVRILEHLGIEPGRNRGPR
ncbi:MAG TPA: four-carbon acid sugar kinase family protein [Spirochaetia bacterium]|nr:four-carbon acid sugar kinase family protein [Spirochaetia bacterium]